MHAHELLFQSFRYEFWHIHWIRRPHFVMVRMFWRSADSYHVTLAFDSLTPNVWNVSAVAQSTLCEIWAKSNNPRLSYRWLNNLYLPTWLGAVLPGIDLRVGWTDLLQIWEDHRSNVDHLLVNIMCLKCCFVSKLEGLKDQILHLLTPPVKSGVG